MCMYEVFVTIYDLKAIPFVYKVQIRTCLRSDFRINKKENINIKNEMKNL